MNGSLVVVQSLRATACDELWCCITCVALGWVTHLECLASQLCRNPSPLEAQQVGNELLQRQCVL